MKYVPVVFTENCPESCRVKPESSGFYRLPDGTETPLNIFEAMNKLFLANTDMIAIMSCCWYFSAYCPERNNKAVASTKYGRSEEEKQNQINARVKPPTANRNKIATTSMQEANRKSDNARFWLHIVSLIKGLLPPDGASSASKGSKSVIKKKSEFCHIF
jgi:hypothetical protein